jgi:hypothetical protein
MIVASEKKKKNISEYVLYMWQLEALIRAFDFNIEAIEKDVFGVFSENEVLRQQYYSWYGDLIQMMEIENIKYEGHLQITKNIVLDLNTLHVSLLKSPEEVHYRDLYYQAAPNLYEFEKKIKDADTNEVEMMFLGLFGLLMMRIKKASISDETEMAMKTFSDLLALLTLKYHEREEKEKNEMMA